MVQASVGYLRHVQEENESLFYMLNYHKEMIYKFFENWYKNQLITNCNTQCIISFLTRSKYLPNVRKKKA